MFIVVSRSCSNCGGSIAVKKFDIYPSEDKIKEIEESIGGMFCIESRVFELKKDDSGNDEISIFDPWK